MNDLMALTLHRPWPGAMFHLPEDLGKCLENRGWLPPRGMLGKRFAVHAGQKEDKGSADWIARNFLNADKLPPKFYDQGIIGTVRLVGVVNQPKVGGELKLVLGEWGKVSPTTALRWYAEGSYGWLLDERQALPEPIACKGYQKFWRIKPEVRAQLEVQHAA